MAERQSDPEFLFLFDLASAEHTYYRWRLHSLAGEGGGSLGRYGELEGRRRHSLTGEGGFGTAFLGGIRGNGRARWRLHSLAGGRGGGTSHSSPRMGAPTRAERGLHNPSQKPPPPPPPDDSPEGDTLRTWRMDPYVMVEGGQRWLPPAMLAVEAVKREGGCAFDRGLTGGLTGV